MSSEAFVLVRDQSYHVVAAAAADVLLVRVPYELNLHQNSLVIRMTNWTTISGGKYNMNAFGDDIPDKLPIVL